LAPASIAWESAPGVPLNGTRLCANLLNKQLNGNRAPQDLLHHLKTEPLVHWSFHPGTRPNGEPRTTPDQPPGAYQGIRGMDRRGHAVS
jgi:hypothetical protein